MTNTLNIVAIDDTGSPVHRRVDMPDLITSFSALTLLVNLGWRLREVTLIDQQGHAVDLPIDAFDGSPMSQQLDQLQQQWQAVLGL